jgi:hypothetical protein
MSNILNLKPKCPHKNLNAIIKPSNCGVTKTQGITLKFGVL